MKNDLIYPCNACLRYYDCSDQWHCQKWWDYFYSKKEETKNQTQTKVK